MPKLHSTSRSVPQLQFVFEAKFTGFGWSINGCIQGGPNIKRLMQPVQRLQPWLLLLKSKIENHGKLIFSKPILEGWIGYGGVYFSNFFICLHLNLFGRSQTSRAACFSYSFHQRPSENGLKTHSQKI